jgi:hypothetical protein
MSVSGQFSCPPPGSFMAVSGQFLVSAVTPGPRAYRRWRSGALSDSGAGPRPEGRRTTSNGSAFGRPGAHPPHWSRPRRRSGRPQTVEARRDRSHSHRRPHGTIVEFMCGEPSAEFNPDRKPSACGDGQRCDKRHDLCRWPLPWFTPTRPRPPAHRMTTTTRCSGDQVEQVPAFTRTRHEHLPRPPSGSAEPSMTVRPPLVIPEAAAVIVRASRGRVA